MNVYQILSKALKYFEKEKIRDFKITTDEPYKGPEIFIEWNIGQRYWIDNLASEPLIYRASPNDEIMKEMILALEIDESKVRFI